MMSFLIGSSIFIWLGIVVIGSVVFTLFKNVILSPLSRVPGPWHTRVTNLRLKAAVVAGNRIHYIHALHARFGPIVRISPAEVSINDAASFKSIHRIGAGFNKSPWYLSLNGGQRLGVFFMVNPADHAARRKIFARAFSKTHLRQYFERDVLEKVKQAVEQMKKDCARTGSADLLKWWTLFAGDVSAHIMFGESFNTLALGKKSDFVQAVETTLMRGGIATEFPYVRTIAQRMPISSVREFFSNDKILEYGNMAVRNSKIFGNSKNIFAAISAGAEKRQDDNPGMLTDEDVRQEAANLIVAGSDTTSVTLTYLVWAVLKHPDIRLALENEVGGLEDCDITDAILETLPILNSVIEETLRLYGAAPGGLPRTVPSGGSILCNHFLPEGTTVTTQSWSLHRLDYYFPNPEMFDPSRWTDAKKTEVGKTVFSPFGAGSRICLGIHLARMELRLATAVFFRELQNAKLAPRMMDEDMHAKNHFLIAPKGHRCKIVI